MNHSDQLIHLLPNFNFVKPQLASPNNIKEWSERFFYDDNTIIGEMNTFRREDYEENPLMKKGLFCQKLFGPITDFICECGFYLDLKEFEKYKRLACKYCKVEYIDTGVRKYNLSYLKLARYIINPFFLYNNIELFLSLINLKFPELDSTKLIEIIYYNETITFLENNDTKSILFSSSNDFKQKINYLMHSGVKKEKIALNFLSTEILKKNLELICLGKEIKKLRSFNISDLTKNKIMQLRVLETFSNNLLRPEWLFIKLLPIIAPDYRPFLLEHGDAELSYRLHDLYVTISDLNFHLSQDFGDEDNSYMLQNAMISKNLQISINNLFSYADETKDNSINNNVRKGLTSILEGKKGQFRNKILGKRVDYSGRSVIISDPTLKLNQCGLPYLIAADVFETILKKKIKLKIYELEYLDKYVDIFIKKQKLFLFSFLKKIIAKEAILLNRAPSLHKGSLQSFTPILTLKFAIHLNPLVCTNFNADFDGDQISINVSLLKASKIETLTVTKPIFNTKNSSNEQKSIKPNQEITLGLYYSTFFKEYKKQFLIKAFSNNLEAISSFYSKKIDLHESILINVLAQKNKNNFFNKKLLPIKKFVNIKKKLFILTISGFFILNKIAKNSYSIESFFLETTVGQLFYNSFFL